MDALGRFGELMRLEPQSLPLDEASLCVAAVAQPGLDVTHGLHALDALAATVPAPTLEALVGELFGSGRFRGNSDDYYDPRNSYLDQVLARGLGIPISLSILAIEVGRRAGVPLSGVGMPGHFLLCDQNDPHVFVDPFDGGRLLGPADCRALFLRSMGRHAPWQDTYLAPVSRAAIVERVVANLRLTFQRTGRRADQRWVMRLRVRCPSATEADVDELARLTADLN